MFKINFNFKFAGGEGQSGMRAYTCGTRKTCKLKRWFFFKWSVKRLGVQKHCFSELEYASSAWSSHTNKGSKRIEAVQNAAARFCTNDYRRRSSVSAKVLGWDSLRTRKLLCDVTLFYKIQHGIVRIPFPPEVIQAPLKSTRNSNTYKKQVIFAFIDAYKHSFFIRTIPVWNRLPDSAVVASSVGMLQAAALPNLRTCT